MSVTYEAVKAWDAKPYTGMRVGATHDWVYPSGHWHERKLSPDQWAVRFESEKRRMFPAPQGSGAPADTRYHWYITAHQIARKVDANAYETFLFGTKHKLAHQRAGKPYWSRGKNQIAQQVQRILRHETNLSQQGRA